MKSKIHEYQKNKKVMSKTDKRITSFDDHLDEQYGKIGTESREKFQE